VDLLPEGTDALKLYATLCHKYKYIHIYAVASPLEKSALGEAARIDKLIPCHVLNVNIEGCRANDDDDIPDWIKKL
jgi:hypothetical protein